MIKNMCGVCRIDEKLFNRLLENEYIEFIDNSCFAQMYEATYSFKKSEKAVLKLKDFNGDRSYDITGYNEVDLEFLYKIENSM